MSTVIGKTLIAPPGEGSTQSFLTIGKFDTELEAVNCDKYINTKFARAMLSIKKATQHNPPAAWSAVPLQDFTSASDIDWSKSLPCIDWQLYCKYRLSLPEIRFIERNIQYRDDLPLDYFDGWAVWRKISKKFLRRLKEALS